MESEQSEVENALKSQERKIFRKLLIDFVADLKNEKS